MTPRLTAAGAAPHRALIAAGGALAFVLTFLASIPERGIHQRPLHAPRRGPSGAPGEWPVRDYFDFGLPLQVLTSTVTLLASGHNLFGEALVTVAFIAAGVALTFAVSAHLSRSLVIATAPP